MADKFNNQLVIHKPHSIYRNNSVTTNSDPDELRDAGSADLRYIGYIISKYKWHILLLVSTVTALTTLLVFSLQPIYQSTATVMLGIDDSLINPDGRSYNDPEIRAEFFATQSELIQSRETAKATIEKLELDKNAWFDPFHAAEKPAINWRNWIPASWLETTEEQSEPASQKESEKPDVERRLIRWVKENLDVTLLNGTSLVEISFETHDPNMAASVANTITQAYIEFHKEQRLDATKVASNWLNEQLEKSQQRIVESAEALQHYREEVGLVDIQGMQNVYAEQLRILAGKLGDARSVRTQSESLYRRAQHLRNIKQLDTLPMVLNNPWVQLLKTQEQELERQIRLDSARFRGAYPGAEESRENINTVKLQIKNAYDQIIDGIKSDYEIALANEKRLQAELALIESKVQEQTRKEFQAEALEKVVVTNRQAFDALLTKLMEARTQSANTVSTIAHIIDYAVPEFNAVKPQKMRTILVAIILAFSGGIGFAFMLDRWNSTLKTREDVELRLDLPVLGELTLLEDKKLGRNNEDPGFTFIDEPRSTFAEGIRTIRTGLTLANLDDSTRTLLVTSTVSGEGKSTVALNLALSLAQLGNVLLIEADLRRPTLAGRCGLDPESLGLADLATGSARVIECIKRVSGDIHLLPAGSTLPMDPLKILCSKWFDHALQKMSEVYDTILIDSAPINLVSDAKLLSPKAAGIIYVVKADDTPHQAVRQGLNALDQTGAPILGVVLNQINTKILQYYGKAKYGYDRYSQYTNYGYS